MSKVLWIIKVHLTHKRLGIMYYTSISPPKFHILRQDHIASPSRIALQIYANEAIMEICLARELFFSSLLFYFSPLLKMRKSFERIGAWIFLSPLHFSECILIFREYSSSNFFLLLFLFFYSSLQALAKCEFNTYPAKLAPPYQGINVST